jgi:hypothetical protein
MTIDRLLLQELLEKGSDVDLLREMMTVVVNRMDLDVVRDIVFSGRLRSRLFFRMEVTER